MRLDPDNKTGLHLWACYGVALSSLAMAFEDYSIRNKDNTDGMDENPLDRYRRYMQERGVIMGNLEIFYSDHFIVSQLQESIYYFKQTRDHLLKTLAGIEEAAGLSGEGIKIANPPYWDLKTHICATALEEPKWEEQWSIYSLEPLDQHCNYGMRDAERLHYLILMDHHHQDQHNSTLYLGNYNVRGPCPCAWNVSKNVCLACNYIEINSQSFFNALNKYRQLVQKVWKDEETRDDKKNGY